MIDHYDSTDEFESRPTASEFIPASEVPGPNRTEKPMLKTLQATGDGGLEMVSHEPHDDNVSNHVYVCDVCGHDEPTEDGIGHHLHHEHVLGDNET